MTQGLTFQESDHSYALDGVPVPGVTSILADVGVIDSRWMNENAAARGTFVHRCVEAFEQGDLDEDLVPPEFVGYITSFKRGRELLKLNKVVGVELRVVNRIEGFAGTVDWAGYDDRGEAIIVDWKSGEPAVSHGLQTWAYSTCDIPWIELDQPSVRRACLYLDKDGGVPRFALHEDMRKDSRDWNAVLRVYQIKRRRRA